jgi:hypothetical protein
MRRRREPENANIAFLDVISCGFGAIILLLMITENSAPVTIEPGEVELELDPEPRQEKKP